MQHPYAVVPPPPSSTLVNNQQTFSPKSPPMVVGQHGGNITASSSQQSHLLQSQFTSMNPPRGQPPANYHTLIANSQNLQQQQPPPPPLSAQSVFTNQSLPPIGQPPGFSRHEQYLQNTTPSLIPTSQTAAGHNLSPASSTGLKQYYGPPPMAGQPLLPNPAANRVSSITPYQQPGYNQTAVYFYKTFSLIYVSLS